MGQINCACHHCLRRGVELEKNRNADECHLSGLELGPALQAFRRKGDTYVKRASGSALTPLWNAAFEFVQALLQGVKTHLPSVQTRCEVHESTRSSMMVEGKEPDGVWLVVRLNPAPIIGDVATPSRFCQEIRLTEEVRFGVVVTPGSSHVTLRVRGLDLPPLSEIPKLRRRVKNALGSDFKPEAAFRWWLENKNQLYPLHESKFHRIYESLWGRPTTAMLPEKFKRDFLWGNLHGAHLHIQSLNFEQESSSAEVRVNAVILPGETEEERQVMEVGAAVGTINLKTNRGNGERFACSVVNFAAMIYGKNAGLLGASAKVMKKLFTGASWWGPGEEGWQKFDNTATCKDHRNSLGILVQEQGRVIWRFADGPLPMRSEARRPQLRDKRACCCRRAKYLADPPASMHLAKHAF